MIYQKTNEKGTSFGVFPFKANYENNTIYGNSIKEIEESITSIFKRENSRLDTIADTSTLVMPKIENVILTNEQQTRFNEYTNIVNITLDDVVNYTLNNKTGISDAYKAYAQQQEIILQGQMITDNEIGNIENGQKITELELIILSKGV